MAQGSRTQIFGLVAVVGLAIGLWLWLRPGTDETTEQRPGSAAAPAAAADGGDGPGAVPLLGADLDPLTAPKAIVTGSVHDPDGKPIAGAQVCAKLTDSNIAGSDRMPPRCVVTQKDGTYRLDGLLGAAQHLHASARGYLPRRYETVAGIQESKRSRLDLVAGQTRAGIDFVLEPGGVEVSGIVRDISGGEIEGAQISASGRFGGNTGTPFTQSDAEGRFSLWVEGPSVRIAAHAEGYGRGSRSAAIPGTFVEVFLTPESVVIGKVVWAESGEPVAHAIVSAGGRGGPFSGGRGRGSAYSGDDGRFRIEGLEPGSYKVRASDELLQGLADEKVHVGLGETSEEIIVRVHPAYSVRGVVMIGDQQPCSFGRVRLKDTKEKQRWGSSNRSQEDGSVLVKGLLPGTYEAIVSCKGFVAEQEYADIVITDASIEGLTWSVHEGRQIAGKVVNAEGGPIEDARISARMKAGKDPRGQKSNSWSEESGEDGTFEMAGLLPGSYDISVWHDDYPNNDKPTEFELPETGAHAELVISLPMGGDVEGTVRDAKGDPVTSVNVRLKGPRWGGGVSTNDQGHFAIPGVAPGEYRITAQKGWSETIRAPGASDDDTAGERIDVRAKETTTVDLVVESQHGTITGRVVGEGGEPIPDAFVDAKRNSDSVTAAKGSGRQRVRWGSWNKQPVLTDEDGRFVLENLAEDGIYTVLANRKGGGEAIAEDVSAGSDVELSVTQTGVLAGVVKLTGGGSPERFKISAVDRELGLSSNDSFLRTNGKWRLTNLPAGKFEVLVDSSAGNAKVEVELAEGGEKTDVELVLSPRIELRGRLVDAETGEPVPGLKVSVGADGGGISFGSSNGKAGQEDISDADGRFVVEDAATGKVRVIIMSPNFGDDDYGWHWLSRRLATEPTEQDIGTIELIKKRTERGQEAGDLGFKRKDSEPGTEPEDVRNVVAFVRPGGPAEAAGLKVGDEIVKVDGQDVTGFNRYRYSKLTGVLPGRKISLELAGGDKISLTAGKPL